MKKEEMKKAVREGYAKVARQDQSCCAPVSSCCGGPTVGEDISKKIGYTDTELESVPEGANMGLGCGNPVALASLKKGDVVLDLGSGGGFDCFLASQKVGPEGRVIGVDMTAEMVEKARKNSQSNRWKNIEFRLGEIENLPVADSSVDVVISNCVINLSTDKSRVFEEAFRVLKPGGRVMISDIVLLEDLPDSVKNSPEAYVGCVAGAVLKDEYLRTMEEAGFSDITVVEETRFPLQYIANDPAAEAIAENLNVSDEELRRLADTIASLRVAASKPT